MDYLRNTQIIEKNLANRNRKYNRTPRDFRVEACMESYSGRWRGGVAK